MKKEVTVVIVDDKAMITDLFESYIKLSYNDVHIHTFNDSRKALAFITDNRDSIDIIITDYKMPIINGIQLLESTSPQTVRIMISGYVSDIAEEKLTEINAFFFEKPVPMKKIGKIIEDRLNPKTP
ncbi:MAG: response regulator [Chitinivibrionales bacterium]|nr:response regulator [Chitinivibrionales bacterium]